ncbi:unnamed protein product, partial [Trichogramma brassicae]
MFEMMNRLMNKVEGLCTSVRELDLRVSEQEAKSSAPVSPIKEDLENVKISTAKCSEFISRIPSIIAPYSATDQCEMLLSGVPSSLELSDNQVLKKTFSAMGMEHHERFITRTRSWKPKNSRSVKEHTRAIVLQCSSPIVCEMKIAPMRYKSRYRTSKIAARVAIIYCRHCNLACVINERERERKRLLSSGGPRRALINFRVSDYSIKYELNPALMTLVRSLQSMGITGCVNISFSAVAVYLVQFTCSNFYQIFALCVVAVRQQPQHQQKRVKTDLYVSYTESFTIRADLYVSYTESFTIRVEFERGEVQYTKHCAPYAEVTRGAHAQETSSSHSTRIPAVISLDARARVNVAAEHRGHYFKSRAELLQEEREKTACAQASE